MLRCIRCDEPVEEARIKAHLLLNGQLPDKCLKCAEATKTKMTGFMVMDGSKGSRKVGAELMILSSDNNPNYKEQLRQATRANRRSR
jgi:hypothetical protein